jgi:hypothetical protein
MLIRAIREICRRKEIVLCLQSSVLRFIHPALENSSERPKFLGCIYAALAQAVAMLSKVCSAAVNGIDAYPVEVEVNVGYGDTLIVVGELALTSPACHRPSTFNFQPRTNLKGMMKNEQPSY